MENNMSTKEQRRYYIENKINEALNKINNAIEKMNIKEEDLDFLILENPNLPLKEEINRELNKLPGLIAYFNQMKTYAQLKLEKSMYILTLKEIEAREQFRKDYEAKLFEYERKCMELLNSIGQEENAKTKLSVIKEIIKNIKPKEPTEKDYEYFIKQYTIKEQEEVINNRYKFNKLKDICIALENKFLSVRALRYNLENENNNYEE